MAKVTVDHTGICDGYAFEAGVEVDLPKTVVEALGESASVTKQNKKEEKKDEEVKNEENKAVLPEEVVTK